MRSTLSASSEWSIGAMCLLPVTAAQVGALAIGAGAAGGGWPVLLVGAASSAGTMALVARARMPAGAKVAQVAVVLLALVLLGLRLDPFGFRAVEAAVRHAATHEMSVEAGAATVASNATEVSSSAAAIRGEDGDPEGVAAALSASLAGVLPPDSPRVEGVISHDRAMGGASTALHWSLTRGGESRWCGTLRVYGSQRDLVVDRFRAAILTAAEASRGQALSCF